MLVWRTPYLAAQPELGIWSDGRFRVLLAILVVLLLWAGFELYGLGNT